MGGYDIVRRRRRRARQSFRAGAWLARGMALAGLTLALLPLVGIAAGAGALLALTRDLPDATELENLPNHFAANTLTTRLYAWDAPGEEGLRHPVLIDEISDPRLAGAGWVRLVDLPPHVSGALLAALDPAFLTAESPQLAVALDDWWRTGTVSEENGPIISEIISTHLRGGEAPQPGDETRGLQDWLLGRQIERLYSRPQLLEWTLNTRYFGHLAYGIEAAAGVYFGKGAAELTAGEAALLAATARETAIDPFDDLAAARRGQADVLAMMVAMNQLTIEAAASALASPLDLAPAPGSDSVAPAFSRMVRRELESILGSERLVGGGWQVETTLEPAMQQQAGCAAAAQVARLSGNLEAPSGGGPPCPARDFLPALAERSAGLAARTAQPVAVVVLNPRTGAIEALTGGEATLAPHLAGTLVRPLIYATALSQGHTAATLTFDVPSIYLQNGQPYSPRNADSRYLGPMRLREALASGRAVPAAQVLNWVGVGRVMDTARALGLGASGSELDSLDFTEGDFLSDLLDLSRAYAAIGNGGAVAGLSFDGELPEPATVRRIYDAQGQEVYAYEPATREALDPMLAFLLNDSLSDGEARCPTDDCEEELALPDNRRAALVTGQSAAGDSWTLGYTPERLIGVWIGEDEPPPIDGEKTNGAENGAAPLWRALMAWASSGPAASWPRPAGLHPIEVCELSGRLPSRVSDCATVREWFAPGTEPSAVDTMSREVAVNRESGRLATIFTPPQLIEQRSYTVYPPEAAAWAAEAGIEAPPIEYDTIRHVPIRDGGAAVESPEPWAAVSGRWPVIGSAGGESFSAYRLAYFPGLLPEAAQLIAEGEAPVDLAELGVWDTTLVDDGLYSLLLTVIRADGTFDEVAIPVTVANAD